eukprot:Sspe_Gene.61404::Locus_34077_Transcript_1_1_Confidence_1.000_Length_2866::g.61404::m.61404
MRMLHRTPRLAARAGGLISTPGDAKAVTAFCEGGGEYIRNTTLREPLPGYSNRWKHFAGYLTNEVTLAHERLTKKAKELSRGSWFAVPPLGRSLDGTPKFHVVTANHVLHPFWYPELYSMDEGAQTEFLKFYSAHDTQITMYTAAADGSHSHFSFKGFPDHTYADEARHLDTVTVHPRYHETLEVLDRMFEHTLPTKPGAPGPVRTSLRANEEDDDIDWADDSAFLTDAHNYPFYFQLLSFDCRPLQPGEPVLVHGHILDAESSLTPVMVPAVVRAHVHRLLKDGEELFLITPERRLEPGMCGGPVTRDGRVIGMLSASVGEEAEKDAGCGLVTSAAAIRSLLLRVEERWRWPQAPSSAWLKSRGLLEGECTTLPIHEGGDTIPSRYLPPEWMPKPVSSRAIRDRIDMKFNDPLPVNYAPPQLPGGPQVPTSRDRTNPYGELPPDSGLDIPALPLFRGYRGEPKVGDFGYDDGAEKAWWILKYGSAENYWRAHGLDPNLVPIPHFKNYLAPLSPSDKGWGLLQDSTEVPPPLLEGGSEGAVVEAEDKDSLPAPGAGKMEERHVDKMGMEHFFGDEEVVVHRDVRRRRTVAKLAAEKREALEKLGYVPLETQKKIESFLQREADLEWFRGDREYVSEERKLLEARYADDVAFLKPSSHAVAAVTEGEDDDDTVRLPAMVSDYKGKCQDDTADAVVDEVEEEASTDVVPVLDEEVAVESLEQSIARRVEEAVSQAKSGAAVPLPSRVETESSFYKADGARRVLVNPDARPKRREVEWGEPTAGPSPSPPSETSAPPLLDDSTSAAGPDMLLDSIEYTFMDEFKAHTGILLGEPKREVPVKTLQQTIKELSAGKIELDEAVNLLTDSKDFAERYYPMREASNEEMSVVAERLQRRRRARSEEEKADVSQRVRSILHRGGSAFDKS